MLLPKSHERFLLHCTLTFRPNRNKGVGLELVTDGREVDALTVFERALKAGKARLEFGKDDAVRITHIERHPKMGLAVILFRRGDPDASAQVYEHKKTGELRRADKTDDDLVAVSAHLFVSLKPLPGGEMSYNAVLEEAPGVSRTIVQSLLSAILEHHNYSYVNDRGDEKETFCRVLLDGVKGERLGEDDKVRFDVVELVKPGDIDGLDMPAFVPREQRLQLKIEPAAVNVLEKIAGLKDWALGHGWSDVRVRVRMPEGKTRVVSVAREADAADVLFIRAVSVPLKKALDPCSDVVSSELLDHARDILKGV